MYKNENTKIRFGKYKQLSLRTTRHVDSEYLDWVVFKTPILITFQGLKKLGYVTKKWDFEYWRKEMLSRVSKITGTDNRNIYQGDEPSFFEYQPKGHEVRTAPISSDDITNLIISLETGELIFE